MILTLVGKMDGRRMVALEEKYQMTMSGVPLVDDIVEVLGRCYKVTSDGQGFTLEDVTHAFRSQGGDDNG